MKEKITSFQNPKIKNVAQLIEKSSERRKQNLIVVEGKREVRLALDNGFALENLFVCEEISKGLENNILLIDNSKIIAIAKPVFEKIAFRENSDGLVALFRPKIIALENVEVGENALVIVLESVEKPGNLGAILRTADAAKVDAVIICDPKTDIYNPNSIRSSIGCVFTNQIATGNSLEVLSWLKRKNIKSYAAALTARKYYHEQDLKGSCAFVMGTEAFGLTEFWLNECYEQIKIPMSGSIDSLNVSTSTAILVFEAMRQRNFNMH